MDMTYVLDELKTAIPQMKNNLDTIVSILDMFLQHEKQLISAKSHWLTPDEYQRQAMRTNDGKDFERLNKSLCADTPINVAELICGAMGLCRESGEVVDIVKKLVFHGHSIDTTELLKELGDVCWYIALICSALNVDMEDVMSLNIQKLKERYPDGFSEEISKSRYTDNGDD